MIWTEGLVDTHKKLAYKIWLGRGVILRNRIHVPVIDKNGLRCWTFWLCLIQQSHLADISWLVFWCFNCYFCNEEWNCSVDNRGVYSGKYDCLLLPKNLAFHWNVTKNIVGLSIKVAKADEAIGSGLWWPDVGSVCPVTSICLIFYCWVVCSFFRRGWVHRLNNINVTETNIYCIG